MDETVSFTIPSDQAVRVVNGICAAHDYDNTALDGETQKAFVKRMVIKWVKEVVISQEKTDAANQARDAVVDDIIIT